MKKLLCSVSLVASFGLLAFLTDCGGGSGSGGTLVKIPASVTAAPSSTSLDLAAAFPTTSSTVSSVNETLKGCASGRTLTCTASEFYVYNSDRNCVLTLNTFTNNGINFNATSGCNSISWLAGSSCSFTSTGVSPQQTVTVSVIQQLSSPTLTTDGVIFEFAQIQQGALQAFTQQSIAFDAPSALIAQAAPQFTFKQLNYLGINSSGAGTFSFDLQCLAQMTVDPNNSSQGLTVCQGATLSSLDYVLVACPSGGFTSSTTAAQLNTLMAAATDYTVTWQGTANSTSSDKLSGTNSVSSIGGFATKVMTGPGQITTTAGSDMCMILRETTVNGSVTVQSYLTTEITLPALPGCQAASTGGTCLALTSK